LLWNCKKVSARKEVQFKTRGAPFFFLSKPTTTTTAATSSSCRARSTLTGPDLEAWESASALVAEQLSIEGSEADDFLETAFGWGKSTYWRGSVEEATPDTEVVSAAMAFLKEDLSMTNDETLAVLRSFPETLNLDAEKQLRGNLALLAKEYKIQGPAAKACVKRTPRFLGMTINCYGDCVGLCDRCLVRF